jgi:hypothetical protein
VPKKRFFLSVVFFALSITVAAQNISTSAQLIAAMHDRYSGKWYRSLTFEQQSITHKPDGTTSTETWYEALLLPGKLRIDIGEHQSGNGMLFANNHLSIFRDGKLASERDYIHPLLVLGFDVYLQPPDATMQELKDLHLDLASFHEDSLEGRPAYVVGAKQGDLQTMQFWIDKERLYFVRLIQPDPKDPTHPKDIRFEDYKRVEGGGWVAEHVAVMVDGKLVFEEKYSDVKVNPPLKEGFFDAQHFSQGTASGATK